MLKYLFLLSQVFFICIISAQTYYVSPTGNATWVQATNIDTPCSISTVNDNVSAGDTVYFRGGTYTTQLNPDGGFGTPTSPMVLKNYPNETPIIDVQTNADLCIDLRDASYTLVEGITVQNPGTPYAILASGYDYPLVHNLTIKNCTCIKGGILANEIDGFNVLNCTIRDTYGASIVINGSEFNKITNTRIENCTITNSGNDAITLHVGSGGYSIGDYHIIRGNVVDGVLCENCYDLTSGNYIIFENNKCSGSPLPGISAGHNTSWIRIKNYQSFNSNTNSEEIYLGGEDMSHVTILNSVFYGEGECAIKINSAFTPGNKSFRIFNNTIDGRFFDDTSLVQVNDNIEDLSLKNNIYYFDTYHMGMGWLTNPADSDMYINSDLYWHASQSPGFEDIWYNHTLSSICTTYGRECNALELDPLFTDVINNDYTLQATSPAIDAGEWLTFITSTTGSGTSFVVDDALWFYDGWNIIDEIGDIVKTQGGQVARITSIDYNTNTINVDQIVSWIQNEGIALDYKGAKPDIGAFEYSESAGVTDDYSKAFDVYPNPTTGKLFIKGELLYQDYSVFTMTGTLVASGKVNANKIDLGKLKSGIYLIKITENKTGISKVIKRIIE